MHDLPFQFREFRRRTQHSPGFAGVADRCRRIARRPSARLGLHRETGDFLARSHNLGDREAAAVAEIERVARLATLKPFDGGDMGIGEVTDVHVIADAGAPPSKEWHFASRYKRTIGSGHTGQER
jgi:hypothetical protein